MTDMGKLMCGHQNKYMYIDMNKKGTNTFDTDSVVTVLQHTYSSSFNSISIISSK